MKRAEEAGSRARTLLGDSGVIAIANREPWIHESSEGEVVATRSPGGLVTGVEPMMKATGGTWIAHGSGGADFDVTDEKGRVAVPPREESYTLSRVALSRDEVNGYYERFANQVLWPLCHLVFVRPRFERDAFETYRAVNLKFAERAAREVAENDVVLVQDYHFALLPAMLRERRPEVAMNLFWHIPWPPAEVFARCPWAAEIVEGMLGADIVGFHTSGYAENFVRTVALVTDHEVSLRDLTVRTPHGPVSARPYPISIEWKDELPTREEGRAFASELGISAQHIALGVDRIDYTKGIPQRLLGVEAYLRRNRERTGAYTYIQLGSPSRTAIEEYANLGNEVVSLVGRINEELGTESWKPIVYEPRNIGPEKLDLYFAMADSALVTPLHDGMNLVAKEYVRSCTDGRGALVLSRFAGAAPEVPEAILVNPWSPEEIADGIERAVSMEDAEKVERMGAMRSSVKNHDIYAWALALLEDTVGVRGGR